MKLLIIGPEIKSLREVKNFTGMQAFYLRQELLARDVELEFHTIPATIHPDNVVSAIRDIGTRDVDHVLALGLRYFTRVPGECASLLRRTTDGKIAQIHDGAILNSPADLTFTHRDDTHKYLETPLYDEFVRSNSYIGWAADADQLEPMQTSEFRVLVDHPMYKPGYPDFTLDILQSLSALEASNIWRDMGYKSFSVRRIVDDGVETVDFRNVSVKPYTRKHIPFSEMKREYQQAHVFMPTHNESVGLTALETAVAGALVVCFSGAIPNDRLKTIRHFEYRREIDWQAVLSMVDPLESRIRAERNNWSVMAERLWARLCAN